MAIEIVVTRDSDQRVFTSDMSGDDSIIEIHFCTSYTQVVVQEMVEGKGKCHDIICPPLGSTPNPVDLIATQGDETGVISSISSQVAEALLEAHDHSGPLKKKPNNQQKAQVYEFADARETAYNPEEYELEDVKNGDYVKVCHNAERFWVVLISNDENTKTMRGAISNDLVNDQPFGFGDLITFEYHNVYDYKYS